MCLPVLCLKDRFTDEGFDAFQNQVAGDVARQILAQLGDQFGVALVLLSQQVKLLLLVTEINRKKIGFNLQCKASMPIY